MATQHPDNAKRPYWNSQAFISTSAELKECYLCYNDLGIDEYNWDWEGKFVDEAVVDRLLHRYFKYFKAHPLGKDKFLTFRIPNPRVEKQFRLARAFMVIITSAQLSASLGFKDPPIFETILPLTETAEEVIDIQEAFRELIGIEHKLLKLDEAIDHIELIPLFEQVGKIIDSEKLLLNYISQYQKKFGKKPEYIRPYCARSDPALNSGLVPTILALKVALSSFENVEKNTGVKLFPMLGTGSLPFRGGLNPLSLTKCLDEYKGVRTLTLQSAFRYDYPRTLVKNAVETLKNELPKGKARQLTGSEILAIKKIIPLFEQPYRSAVETLAPLINRVSDQVARRRERMLHIGLFGYSRGVGSVTLPRAITFTAALYSLGIPPELIGTGRGLLAAKHAGLLNTVQTNYLHLKEDLIEAGYFLNKNNLTLLIKKNPKLAGIRQDIDEIENILEIELGPKEASQMEHVRLSGRLLSRLNEHKKISQLITLTGILRRSLG
jgi:phosphoenolpyruvate carboxylase